MKQDVFNLFNQLSQIGFLQAANSPFHISTIKLIEQMAFYKTWVLFVRHRDHFPSKLKTELRIMVFSGHHDCIEKVFSFKNIFA